MSSDQQPVTPSNEFVGIHDSQDEDLQPKVNANSFVIIRTVEEAEKYGVPIIHSLRNEEIRFVLRKTNHPQSHLSDKAREQLYLDALDLEKTWLRRKLDGFRNDEFTSSQSSTKTALQYRGKVLAEHYQVTTSTVSRILKLGRMTASTNTRPRSGRPSVFTRTHQQHVLKKSNDVNGCSTRTLEVLLEEDPPNGYLTRYKGKERHSPGPNTLKRLLRQEELVIQNGAIPSKVV